MILEQLINEFITKHLFPQFREWKHPSFPDDKYFVIGDDGQPIAMISPFDNNFAIIPPKWVLLKSMFSLTEDETIVVLGRWFSENVPHLSFGKIQLLRYP